MAVSVSLPVSSFFSVVPDGNLVPLNTSRNYTFFPLRFKMNAHVHTHAHAHVHDAHLHTPRPDLRPRDSDFTGLE